ILLVSKRGSAAQSPNAAPPLSLQTRLRRSVSKRGSAAQSPNAAPPLSLQTRLRRSVSKRGSAAQSPNAAPPLSLQTRLRRSVSHRGSAAAWIGDGGPAAVVAGAQDGRGIAELGDQTQVVPELFQGPLRGLGDAGALERNLVWLPLVMDAGRADRLG